jgi:AraC-like DNA-binding protein
MQSPPDSMRVSLKKRIGARTTAHSKRRFNNTTNFVESWPADDQATFRFPALVFVTGGEAHFHVADYAVHCPNWHFLLFRTGVPRPLGNRPHLENSKGSCDIVWMFTPPGTNSVTVYVCHCRERNHWHEDYRVVHRPEVIHLFKLLIDELEEESGNEKIIDLSFQTFLHLLLHELQHGRFYQAGTSPTKNIPSITTSQIEQAEQYIKSHLNHHLTTASVARQVYMSRNSFIERFQRETGLTFHDYITHERMEAARQLLCDKGWSVDLVCRFIGLKPTQLRSQFKSRFGITPSQFRKDGQNR